MCKSVSFACLPQGYGSRNQHFLSLTFGVLRGLDKLEALFPMRGTNCHRWKADADEEENRSLVTPCISTCHTFGMNLIGAWVRHSLAKQDL